MIEIVQTKPDASDFNLFMDFPKEIYASDSVRFKLPETINVEFLDSCFVLIKNGKPQARAALYNNPGLYYQNKKSFCIGNYESVNDLTVSKELLTTIASLAKKKGAQFLIGPMNGSTWDSYRFSIDHNDPNFFLEPYHHLYYNQHFSNFGFSTISSYFSGIDSNLICGNPSVIKREAELLSDGVDFRTLNMSEYDKELERLYDFNSIAFKANFLYTPISKQTFIKKYADTKKVINPDFVLIAEDVNQNLIGYIFSVDDFFNTTGKSLIIKTAARHPDKRWTGLGHVMGDIIYRKAIKQNYKSVIHAFLIQGGTSTKMSKNFSGTIYKNYALYGKEIS